jgi:hypothetical protein
MVQADIIEKMYVHIALKKSQSSFRYKLTPEMLKLWEQITYEIKEIQQRGDSLEIVAEIPDIEIPNPA